MIHDKPKPPFIKRFFCGETIVFLSTWALLMSAGRNKLFRDPGTFSHITWGDYIFSSHTLIYSDIFSFTFAGKPWISQQWLGDCLMSFIHKIGSLDGLLIITATCFALLNAWLMNRLMKAGLHFLLAFSIISLYTLAGAHHYHVRPHLASIFFLAITFSWLCNFEAQRLKSSASLLFLTPLFILWTNIHGGVLGGLGTVGIAILGWSVIRIFFNQPPIKNYKEMLFLSILFLTYFLSIFMNPYGGSIPKAWLSIMSSDLIPVIIQEHASVIRTGTWQVLPLGILYIVALIGIYPRRPKVTWLIPIVWFALSWSRTRNTPLFAVTAVIALSEFFPHVRWARWLSSKGSMIFRIKTPERSARIISPFHLSVPLALVATAVFFILAPVQVSLLGHGWVKLDNKHWPIDLLPELKKYEKDNPDGFPILNDMIFGGFLMHYAPRLRVFIDDRCELYQDDFLLDYVTANPVKIETWVKKYNIEVALVEPKSAFENYFQNNAGWKVLKVGESAVLYEKLQKEHF